MSVRLLLSEGLEHYLHCMRTRQSLWQQFVFAFQNDGLWTSSDAPSIKTFQQTWLYQAPGSGTSPLRSHHYRCMVHPTKNPLFFDLLRYIACAAASILHRFFKKGKKAIMLHQFKVFPSLHFGAGRCYLQLLPSSIGFIAPSRSIFSVSNVRFSASMASQYFPLVNDSWAASRR